MRGDKKIKVAVYSGEIPSTTFIERLIQGLLEHDCDIVLYGLLKSKPSYSNYIILRGYKGNRFSKLLMLLKYSTLLWVFKRRDKKRLDAFLKSESRDSLYNKVKYYPVIWDKPDIFHLQWAKGVKEWFWVKNFDIKLVLSLRGAHINYSPLYDKKLASAYKELFPNVDRFHAVSKAIAREAQKYGACKKKIDVVYSGLVSKRGNSHEINENQVFNIVSVGRSHWKKGYHYALDAFYLLKQQGLSFTYTIIGVDQDIELLYQIDDLNLKDRVKLIHRLPFNQVESYIKNADVLLLPSVEEGVANVVLEAMANATLVLSTNCGGMSEVIEHGKNGFLVPTRNPEAIAEGIEEIMALDDHKKKIIKENARDTIKLKHNTSSMIKGMLSIYEKALN